MTVDSGRLHGFLRKIEWLDAAPKDYKVTTEYHKLRRETIVKQGELIARYGTPAEFYLTRDELNYHDSDILCSAFDRYRPAL